MAVITISRQYGSGADDIAAQVCDKLGYRYFDKRVMAGIASEFGLPESGIVDFSEDQYKARGFLDRFRGPRVVAQTRTWREDLSGRRVPEVEQLDEEQAIRMVRSAIQSASQEDNIVILGRGSQAILRDKPGVLHVRIEAPPDDRVKRIREQENVSEQEAGRIVAARDKAAADYLKRFYEIDWSNSLLYHLVINTGRMEIDAAVPLIVNALSYLSAVESPE